MDLLDVLSNTLILQHTAPYIPITSLLNLAATSKAFQRLIFNAPSVFRYLNLSTIQARRACAHKEYSMSSRRMFAEFNLLYSAFTSLARRGVLQDVRILILDGLYISVELLHDILCCQHTNCPIRVPNASDVRPCPTCYPLATQCPVPCNVRILSIRQSMGFYVDQLQGLLKHIARPDRPKGSPRIQGIYCFGPMDSIFSSSISEDSHADAAEGVTTAFGSQLGTQGSSRSSDSFATRYADTWYVSRRVNYAPAGFRSGELRPQPNEDWNELLDQCKGIIFFDTIKCQNSLPWKWDRSATNRRMKRCTSLANVCLGSQTCQDCHAFPQGGARYTGEPSADLPLLSPPPLHSSSIAVAQRVSYDSIDTKDLVLRAWCDTCLDGRHCQGCLAFWCGTCCPFDDEHEGGSRVSTEHTKLKVYFGLCVEKCLVEEMYLGAGSGGMWG